MKKIQYLIEALALKLLFTAFRLLPLDVASYMGGFMARSVGPFLKAHRIAQHNLAMIFPDMPPAEKRRLLTRVWDNLGRTAAELPNLSRGALFDRVVQHGAENLPDPAVPVMFFSGHMGNWELTYPVAFRRGVKVTLLYRHANNPYVEKIITGIRAHCCSEQIAKGARNAIKVVRAIKNRYSLAMLIDQKMNDGIAVPFFGRQAMTAPAIAEFALAYDLPIIPARVVRRKGCHFDCFTYPPLSYTRSGDHEKDVLAIMTEINRMLEQWIREYPDQWFWVHKRWPD